MIWAWTLFLAFLTGVVFLCLGYDPVWLLVAVSVYFGRLWVGIEVSRQRKR